MPEANQTLLVGKGGSRTFQQWEGESGAKGMKIDGAKRAGMWGTGLSFFPLEGAQVPSPGNY